MQKSLVCNTSELHSEEEEEIQLSKRKRKAIHYFGDTSDDSEDEGHPSKTARPSSAPVIPSPPCAVQSGSTAAPPPPIQPPTTHGIERGRQGEAHSQVYRPTWRGGRTEADGVAYSAAEVQILSLLEYLKQQQEQLIVKVNYLTSKLTPTGQDSEVSPDPIKFPLTSMEEVEAFEDWLKDPANSHQKQSMIRSLATIGGHDTKRVIWNILAHMFNDDVGRRINWKGVNNKKSFSQMSAKTLLLQSVRKNHVGRLATDEETYKHTIRWFNLAADRGASRRRPTVSISTPDLF
ncbi:uncharacterized protein LOC117821885 [Notolabrus celidotus]|uniref:uncharacterized protein LOC117821885 n=1 Tax=Notolabrus celidotus TaxID=1203425 RepID=UPI0014902489|nr:uncharacterized protein LOC117821885 [Notolabrus celidotus]XP_034552332.1 uncharacterized protein LOC117821885 [Notolabrus celidotus]